MHKLSQLLIMLAFAALLSSHVQAQEVPPVVLTTPKATATTETAETVSADGIEHPTRPENKMLPTVERLSGPIQVLAGVFADGTQFVGLTMAAPNDSGYGRVTNGPVKVARMFFSNSFRSTGGDRIILRAGTPRGLQFPLAVKTTADGFEIYALDDNVMVKNALTGEPYPKGKPIPFLLPYASFSTFIDVDFGEYLDFLQVLIEKDDNKSDTAANFLWVDKPRPEPPGRGQKTNQP